MFGSEYDEAVARARLGSAYDNQLSDIAEERLEVPGRKLGKRRNTLAEPQELYGYLLDSENFDQRAGQPQKQKQKQNQNQNQNHNPDPRFLKVTRSKLSDKQRYEQYTWDDSQ